MAPPSPLSIATKAVARLLKERVTYRLEIVQQTAKIDQLQADIASGHVSDEQGNDEFMLRQLRRARDESEAVLVLLRTRIADAVRALEAHVAEARASSGDGAELEAAQGVLERAVHEEKGIAVTADKAEGVEQEV